MSTRFEPGCSAPTALFDAGTLAQLEAAREAVAAHVRVTQWQAAELDRLRARVIELEAALAEALR